MGEERPVNQIDCPLCLIIWERRILPLCNFLLGRNKQFCIDLSQAQDAQLVRTCNVVTSGKSVKGAVKTFVT